MPLQIRRGLDAERTQIAPSNGLVEGELLYVTDEKKLYIGTGSVGEHQGVVITGYTDSNAKDAAAQILTSGEHVGIGFAYDSGTKKLNATVDLSAFEGPIVADALKGSVFADDSSILLDAIDKVLYGSVTGNLTGNVTGNLTGNVTGDVTGDVLGNLIGDVTGELVGNVTGSVTGDVVGSIFGDDSAVLVDGIGSKIVGDVDNNTVTTVNLFSGILESKTIRILPDEVDGLAGLSIVTTGTDDDDYDLFNIFCFNDSLTVGNSSKYVRARGTNLIPAIVQAGDIIHQFSANALAGVDSVVESVKLSMQVDSAGTVSDTQAPGKFVISTQNNSGVMTEALTVDMNGLLGLNSNQSLVAGVGVGEVDFVGGAVSFVKIKVGSTIYAMPLYAINS
jgi:outer membrane lipoprotein SlyB